MPRDKTASWMSLGRGGSARADGPAPHPRAMCARSSPALKVPSNRRGISEAGTLIGGLMGTSARPPYRPTQCPNSHGKGGAHGLTPYKWPVVDEGKTHKNRRSTPRSDRTVGRPGLECPQPRGSEPLHRPREPRSPGASPIESGHGPPPVGGPGKSRGPPLSSQPSP